MATKGPIGPVGATRLSRASRPSFKRDVSLRAWKFFNFVEIWLEFLELN